MTLIWIFGFIIAYLIIGALLGAVLEDKGYIIIHQDVGYFVFAVFWFPICLIAIVIVLYKQRGK